MVLWRGKPVRLSVGAVAAGVRWQYVHVVLPTNEG